jgi:hypothetical protein
MQPPICCVKNASDSGGVKSEMKEVLTDWFLQNLSLSTLPCHLYNYVMGNFEARLIFSSPARKNQKIRATEMFLNKIH